MTVPPNRLPLAPRDRTSPPAPSPTPILCIVGETLCHVRVWTEEEWDRLEPAERPTQAEHVPGLGWVGATLGGVAR